MNFLKVLILMSAGEALPPAEQAGISVPSHQPRPTAVHQGLLRGPRDKGSAGEAKWHHVAKVLAGSRES